ncbi:MAG TPA: NAD(+) synthase [Clostridiaceae bacterium]|nr:NAD(+) synthase [Clostridiaceae bacterium]
MSFGFVRVAAAVPRIKVADCEYNAANIINIIRKAEAKGIQIIVFPELSITAYTCGDLFHQEALLKGAEAQLSNILESTKDTSLFAVLGMPVYSDNQLFNCGVAIQGGKILGVVPKTYLPGYNEFYEERWFATGQKASSDTVFLCGQQVPFGSDLLFEADPDSRVCLGIEICEDLWAPISPSSYQAVSGATVLLNLSASNDIVGKCIYRRELARNQSAKCIAAYIYSSSGIDESTTDVVFGGHALICENGEIIAESERFIRDEQLIYTEIDVERLVNDRFKNTVFMEGPERKKFRKIVFKLNELKDVESGNIARYINPHPFVPSDESVRNERCREIFAIQTAGLAKRLEHTGTKHAVIGISGGLDSTLALLVTAKTFDLLDFSRKNIIAITMPGFGTTDETYKNAHKLMESLNVSIREINIKEACLQHFRDIGHDVDVHDVTYENVQARERTQILMDVANKVGGLVIGTGDLSEMALGWSTYNGDHMSMYSVNCGIPKTLVRYLVKWAVDNVADKSTAEVLRRILETPITPELLPPGKGGKINQKTEEIIGPYELHDFFLYHMVRYGAPPKKILFLASYAFRDKYSKDTIKKWLKVFYKRFFSQQFKRSCIPDGPKVGTISLSPRGDWRMPSDAESRLWIRELEG